MRDPLSPAAWRGGRLAESRRGRPSKAGGGGGVQRGKRLNAPTIKRNIHDIVGPTRLLSASQDSVGGGYRRLGGGGGFPLEKGRGGGAQQRSVVPQPGAATSEKPFRKAEGATRRPILESSEGRTAARAKSGGLRRDRRLGMGPVDGEKAGAGHCRAVRTEGKRVVTRPDGVTCKVGPSGMGGKP